MAGVATPKANGDADRQLKARLETVRSVIIAAHNAAGFLWEDGAPQCARLLRSSEALARQALALLGVHRTQAAGETGTPKKHKKKQKAKKKKEQSETKPVEGPKGEDAAMSEGGGESFGAPGDLVVMGDLTEFGLTQQTLVVASSQAAQGASHDGPDGLGASFSPQASAGSSKSSPSSAPTGKAASSSTRPSAATPCPCEYDGSPQRDRFGKCAGCGWSGAPEAWPGWHALAGAKGNKRTSRTGAGCSRRYQGYQNWQQK